ncbi:MAG: putative bifunctional diguanylate cyclase/phosphodiesterase [Desulfuromonadaceae bacterium]
MKTIERIFRLVASFRSKQLLVIMLACSIVLVTTTSCFLAFSYLSFNHESRVRLEALGDILGADISAALAFGDYPAIAKSLEALRADSSVKQLFVLNERDQISAYYHQKLEVVPDNVQQRLSTLRSEVRSPYIVDVSPGIEKTISRDGNRLGTILIEQDERIIIKQIAVTAVISAVILLFTLGLSYALANRFQRVITDPLTAMAVTMQEVSATRDYSQRVSSCDTDEMNLLAERFNEMLTEIEKRDVELLERQDQLHHMANYDTLTGLPNRALFNDRLEQALLLAARTGEGVAVLFIDLDNFKAINDTHGHCTGDLLLLEAAARLASGTRVSDTVARLGGDEFTVFLRGANTPEIAMQVARKYIENLYLPYEIENNRLYVSASIGIALFPEHGVTPETLIKNADAAMYQAKEKGKNSVELFSQSLHAKFSEQLGLSNDLHRALELGEFELYYQPRINLVRNSWSSVEALIRWNHPEIGLVPPDKFLALAEQNGLILPIGEWVLREACRQLRQWHCQGFYLPRVSVNISPLQLQRQDLYGIVRDAVSSNHLCTRSLELEIVESALVDNVGHSISILKKLKDIGVKISIDDFGTGYSSLSYLRTLPVDILKIDRSFMLHAHESDEDNRMLASIISMSHSIGLEVVTEGVELAEQELLLKNHNCQEAQGYFYSRPLPATKLLHCFFNSRMSLEDMHVHTIGHTKDTCCMQTDGPVTPCRNLLL